MYWQCECFGVVLTLSAYARCFNVYMHVYEKVNDNDAAHVYFRMYMYIILREWYRVLVS